MCGVIENVVVSLPVPGEIFFCVIDGVVSSYRSHHILLYGVVDPGHLGLERFGYLHRKRARTTTCAVDQDILSGLNFPSPAETEGGKNPRLRHSRCLLECQACRLQC